MSELCDTTQKLCDRQGYCAYCEPALTRLDNKVTELKPRVTDCQIYDLYHMGTVPVLSIRGSEAFKIVNGTLVQVINQTKLDFYTLSSQKTSS